MTREECEQMIIEKTREIWNEYLKYNPDGKYLTITVVGGRIMSNNSAYDDDKDTPIEVFEPLNEEEENEDE